MNVSYKDPALYELYMTGSTKDKKYKKLCKDERLVKGYRKVVKIMYDVKSAKELRNYSSLHYEKLKYQKDEPKSSVRIVNGMIERLIFTETANGIEVELIEIDDTHYGNRK